EPLLVGELGQQRADTAVQEPTTGLSSPLRFLLREEDPALFHHEVRVRRVAELGGVGCRSAALQREQRASAGEESQMPASLVPLRSLGCTKTAVRPSTVTCPLGAQR
ncbi:hypothetical protein ABTY98_37390, partial [Streptomyces sp. NPDC096040]|uniref:hypothetical protein n=1 Tax=Streptomyces sp. NPDC096040 TaxID=3155541 RepID=UPI003316FB0A